MTQSAKPRKRRSDRNHVIYMIENAKGEQYIGLTVLSFNGNADRTVSRRAQKHVQRAYSETKSWTLCESLRKYGPEQHTYEILEIVRGKKQAHARETELINTLQPCLNTFGVR